MDEWMNDSMHRYFHSCGCDSWLSAGISFGSFTSTHTIVKSYKINCYTHLLKLYHSFILIRRRDILVNACAVWNHLIPQILHITFKIMNIGFIMAYKTVCPYRSTNTHQSLIYFIHPFIYRIHSDAVRTIQSFAVNVNQLTNQ